MKKLIVMLVVCLLGAAGCDDEITPEQLQQFAGQVEELTTKVDDYQKATDEVIGTFTDIGIIGDDVAEKVEKISGEIDRVQPQVKAIAEAVRTAEYSGQDDLTTILEAIQAANRASGAFNPVALYVEVGLSAAIVLLGLFARRKAAEATQQQLKYQAHKQGVERTMKEISALGSEDVRKVEPQLYNNIGEARTSLGVK